jgi:cytochrome oxidase Cu insertion factor (SCO1/SenC/PrrC family)
VRAVPSDEDLAAGPPGTRPPRRPVALIVALVLSLIAAAAVVGVILSVSGGRTAAPVANQAPGTAAGRNPDVDPGTSLPGPAAPGFTLTDQYGARISLRQFRGRAVVIAFVDARCTTVCPLTTVSLTEAVSMLGPAAGRHVQLLGIDANPDATRVADVRAYSTAYQMMRSWDFLTGSRRELTAVWHAYHVYVAASHGNIDHEPAVYLIDPQGRERTLYLTQMAYASIPQQAQLIAGGLSRLLPGHPALHGTVPMALARGVSPATSASLPVIGGDRQAGHVSLGPGHRHVIVFLASWDSEVSDLTAELRMLAGYQRQALRRGWPSVVAVDESRTETSPAGLTRLLARAGGAKLGYPVVADATGRLADGYAVQDLPWIEITTTAGKIRYRHDGWIPAASLTRTAAGSG